MIPVRILGTGSALPKRIVTTRELAERAYPDREAAAMVERTGIESRRFLGPGESAASLGVEALKAALAAAHLEARQLSRILFVSSSGGDHRIPATANGVLGELGLDGSCDAFDLNNSCAGFLSALDVAARSVATGMPFVAVVSAETFSRHTAPDGRRAYLILGDAAAAVVLGAGRPGEGILASRLRNTAALRGKMQHPLPDRPDGKHIVFDVSNEELGENALASIRENTASVLAAAGLRPGEFEWFLPHQPNGRMLEFVTGTMGVPASKLVPVVREIGSVGSAAIPFSLDRLMRERPVKAGDRILMATVGAGTAEGAMVYRVAP